MQISSDALSGPGKLPPRLLKDLVDYDPRRALTTSSNLLFDSPPRWRPNEIVVRRKPGRDCQHTLFRKEDQCILPQPGENIESGADGYRSASICTKCLHHFDVTVTTVSHAHLDGYELEDVCGRGREFPMHHFQQSQSRRRSPEDIDLVWNTVDGIFDPWVEEDVWHCSAPNCPAILEVKITPPRLDAQKRELLADRHILRERGERILHNQPDRFKPTEQQPQQWLPLLPGDALNVLRQYLVDSQKDGPSRRVAAQNKKFLLAFADDCNKVLEWLGFRSVTEAASEYWLLPALSGSSLRTAEKNNRHLVNDVVVELLQILTNLPPEDRTPRVNWVYSPVSAISELYAVMGITGYNKSQTIDLDNDEHPYYAGLGVTKDCTDELISFAYQRQKQCDPVNEAYYFECLKDLAKGRGSEQLEMDVVTAESLGQHTQSEIDAAYQYFVVDSGNSTTDDYIINLYETRIESAPRQADEAKQCLLVIGEARQSSRIIDVANTKKMTVQDALEFLGVQDNPNPDVDTIRAAATIIILDGDKDKVVRAVQTIAEFRDDFSLRLLANELESGAKAAYSSEDAYKALQLSNKNVPDETIVVYFTQLWDNNASAGSKQSFLQALDFIANERDSSLLKTKVKNPNGQIELPQGEPDQPVGLANIGNTCYLNSLLQYYYTVRAVREVVMNFDHYRMDITDETVAKKRVGGRAVKRNEIVRAQKFVPLLAGLYEQLKVAPTQSVRPTQDLAEMTLWSAEADEQFRRASMSGILPETISIAAVMNTNNPCIGPQMAPPTRPAPLPNTGAVMGVESEDMHDVEMNDTPFEDMEQEDAASDATLVDDEMVSPPELVKDSSQNDAHMADAIDLTTDETAIDDTSPDDDAVNPTKFVLRKGDPAVSVIELDNEESDSVTQKPEVPPRVKPSPIVTSGIVNSKSSKLELGAQQDVTEVIGNLMFNLQCAIKPSSIDSVSGEQGDMIRDTFYGSTNTYTQKGSSYDSKVEPWSNLIVYPSTEGSRTIYEALDVQFDEQTVELDNANALQYASVEVLPPVLQIQIQRTQYDTTLQRASKNQNRVEFDETIYLDRYMNSEKVLPRRKESSKRKVRLAELNRQQQAIEAKGDDNLDKRQIYNGAADFLRSLQEDGFDNDIPDILDERLDSMARQLNIIEEERKEIKARLKEDFTDMREHRYTLQAVFMHKGDSVGGHHWVYIYDFKNSVWREYNDERVEVVKDLQKIYGHGGWSENDPRPATAHYLVYVRDDIKNDLVDAVCRDMRPAEIVQPQDQPFEDVFEMDTDAGPEASHIENNQYTEAINAWEAIESSNEGIDDWGLAQNQSVRQ